MRMFALLGALLGAALAVGCQSVLSDKPLGRVAAIEPVDWNGSWLSEDGVIQIQVLDAETGTIWISSLDEQEPVSYTVQLRRLDGWTIANLMDESASRNGYPWHRVESSGQLLLVWTPDYDRFRALVEQGQLPGEVRDGDVVLDELSEQQLRSILRGEHGVLFEWEEPFVLLRPPA